MSSTEAEYMAFSEATKEALHLKGFLLELRLNESTGVTIFCDNMGALKLAENPSFHARSKHIDVQYHFIRNAIKEERVDLRHVSTDDMVADILTKGLP